MAVDTRGSLHSWGSPEYGQLGHNDDGKYFVTASKLAFQNVTTPQRIERFIEKDPKEKSAKVRTFPFSLILFRGSPYAKTVDLMTRPFTSNLRSPGRF